MTIFEIGRRSSRRFRLYGELAPTSRHTAQLSLSTVCLEPKKRVDLEYDSLTSALMLSRPYYYVSTDTVQYPFQKARLPTALAPSVLII